MRGGFLVDVLFVLVPPAPFFLITILWRIVCFQLRQSISSQRDPFLSEVDTRTSCKSLPRDRGWLGMSSSVGVNSVTSSL